MRYLRLRRRLRLGRRLYRSDRGGATTRRLSAAIFIVALVVRLLPLGLYVTPDEPIWVLRSLQFLEALKAGDPQLIPQTGHPGVTTMALGALGVWLTTLLHPSDAALHADWALRITSLAPENGVAFPHLAFFLPLSRLSVALATSVGLVLAYLIGRRRLGEGAARLLALFLAVDPFFAGHAGLLHTDALQATFIMLSVLLMLPMRTESEGSAVGWWSGWSSLGGAALFLALAGLTKMLGLLAAPGLAMALFVAGDGPWPGRLLRVVALTALTVVFLTALYPPAWVDPRSAAHALLGAVTYHESIGLRSVFFAGQTTTDPGPWFYPAVLLFRLTLPVFLGLVCVRPRESFRNLRKLLRDLMSHTIVPWCLLPILSYLGAITVADKKFDRYALTVVPLLALIAALRWSSLRRGGRVALLALLLLPWSLVALVPLHYATPLLGGPWLAQRVVPLGWGDASGLAVHRLKAVGDRDELGRLTLMARNVPGAASTFPGETWAWAASRLGCTDLVIEAETGAPEGYVKLDDVTVAGRWQTAIYRRASVEAISLPLVAPGPLPGVPADAVAPIGDTQQLQAWLMDRFGVGEPFVWLHAPQCYQLTQAQLVTARGGGALTWFSCEAIAPVYGFEAERCRFTNSEAPDDPRSVAQPFLARFGGTVDLIAAAWPALVEAPTPLTVRLRWQPHVQLGALDVYLALRDRVSGREIIWAEGGRQALSDWGWPSQAWPQGTIVDGEAYVPLSLALAPGRYRLVLRLAGPEGWLGLSLADGTFAGTELDLGEVQVGPARHPAAQLDLDVSDDLAWPGLRVIGYRVPSERVEAGRPLSFELGLERDGGTPPKALTWMLACAEGREVGELLPWPTSDPSNWPEGYRYKLRFAPRVPATLPAGECEFVVAPVGDDGGGRLSLGTLHVEQRPHVFDLPTVPAIEVAVVAENLGQLVGSDVTPRAVYSGEGVSVTLYWRALGAAERDYTVFVQLIGPDGQAWGQSDSRPAKGAASTMTWISGEIIVDQHDLTLRDDAPAGRYGVYAGLYDADSGTRWALYEAGRRVPEDRVRIAELQVVARQ